MKKIIIVAAMLAGSGIFVTPGFAGRLVPDRPAKAEAVQPQVSAEMVNGVVVSVNLAMNQVVIRDGKTNQQRTLTASADDITSLRRGDRVEARVKAGTNMAESITENMPVKAQPIRAGY